jgi:TM2 domain-containing membrane protein YozV
MSRMNKVGTAYILWLGCLVGVNGLHRLYNGKFFTGILWLCTGGLFGIGQVIDLLLIPRQVEVYNNRLRNRHQAALAGDATRPPAIHRVVETPAPQPLSIPADPPMIALLKAAEARGGRLSVTQGVLATGLGFTEVESILQEMLKSGYVDVANDPESGIVIYDFKEL